MQMMRYIILKLVPFYIPFTLSLALQFLLIRSYQYKSSIFIPNMIAVIAHLFLFFGIFFPEDIYLYTIMVVVVYNYIYVLRHKKSWAMYMLSLLLLLYGVWAGILTMLAAHGNPSTVVSVVFIFTWLCFIFGLFILVFAQNTKEQEKLENESLDQDDPED